MQLTIIQMDKDAQVSIPLDMRTYGSVRSVAYKIGRRMGRKYKTHLVRETMTCEVKRVM